jgi:putative membrane protein
MQRTHGRVDDPAIEFDDEDDRDGAHPSGDLQSTAPRRYWRSTFWLLAALFASWLAYAAVTGLATLWQESIWLALPVSGLVLALLISASLAIRREFTAMRRVDALPSRNASIVEALETDSLVLLKEALSPTIESARNRYPHLIDEFEAAAADRGNTRDYAVLFNNLIIKPLDEEANKLIKRTSIVVGAAVTVLPHPALDAAVVLWKASTLMRQIGDIYGLDLTGLSSLRLFKHIITSAVLAAGMEEMGDIMLEQIGRGIMESAGKKSAEGIVIAWRVHRLGMISKELCCPAVQL